MAESKPGGQKKGVAPRGMRLISKEGEAPLPTPRKEDGPAPLIVGIGASAGGLEAFKAFFEHMPSDSGMAFVLVQHLSPDHKSMLAELLGKTTAMTVTEAEDGAEVLPNHVFVIPPNATLTMANGRFVVLKPAPPRETRRPIDAFLFSLARDQGENAVCVIMSGIGSDGSLGLASIKEHGELTIAQADIDQKAKMGMPSSAAATGFVDHVLEVKDIPAKLIEYHRHLLWVRANKNPERIREDAAGHLMEISALLRAAVGHDFSEYKENTFVRRIQRRMQVLHLDSVKAYLAELRANSKELELLFRDLLIGVTQFFRDPSAFEALETKVIPNLFMGKGPDDQVRVWVAGCATGEEAYSVAILLMEAAAKLPASPRIMIFATDIDDRALAHARAGRYPRSQLDYVSPQRLERWFVREGDHYTVSSEIREPIVFSVHSVLRDPPFSEAGPDFLPVDKGYLLRRADGTPVVRLSEGEKTAVTFCYFVASLQANNRKKEDLIVVIDDPISSLDTRALNYMAALIKAELGTVGQLFVLTHNLPFMIEMRKWIAPASLMRKASDAKQKNLRNSYRYRCIKYTYVKRQMGARARL